MGPFLMYEIYTDGVLTEAGRLERGHLEDDAIRHARQAMTAKALGSSWSMVITDPDGELPLFNIGVDGAAR